MKKTIAFAPLFLIIILAKFSFNATAAAYPNNRPNPHGIKSNSKYSAMLKRLNFYKKDLVFLSSKISKKKKNIKDLRNKIKNAEDKIKKLKNKIKKDGFLIKELTMRIFIINKEYDSAKYSFIINYQLKTLLKKEEIKLSKLIKRKNKFLKLKKYLKKEKNSLILAVKSINGTKRKLEGLIADTYGYIKSVKIKYKHNKNKKDRLLKRKVIKLIHNLNNSSKKNDIKFIIMR